MKNQIYLFSFTPNHRFVFDKSISSVGFDLDFYQKL